MCVCVCVRVCVCVCEREREREPYAPNYQKLYGVNAIKQNADRLANYFLANPTS